MRGYVPGPVLADIDSITPDTGSPENNVFLSNVTQLRKLTVLFIKLSGTELFGTSFAPKRTNSSFSEKKLSQSESIGTEQLSQRSIGSNKVGLLNSTRLQAFQEIVETLQVEIFFLLFLLLYVYFFKGNNVNKEPDVLKIKIVA